MSATDVKRFTLPAAYTDPAFIACLDEAISTPELVAQFAELVAQFDRLYGADLRARRPPIVRMVDQATGKMADDMREFVHFVHQGVYLTLSDDAIRSLRVEACEP
jgi:hypothetical protein